MNEENKNVEKIKIIIVDDDKFLLSMYALKFKNKGYEVEVALGGEEAINKIKAGCHPDIIISDVIMPKMDGFEFVEKVKNENLAPKAVYVILTNQGQTTDIERAVKLGVDGYIVKATTIPSEVVDEVADIYLKKKNK
ncbi:MAG: response regulator [bacterium]